MPRTFSHLLLFLTAAVAVPAPAAFLNFDDLPASTNISGLPNNPASVLTTQLSSVGILFGRAGVSAGVSVASVSTFNDISAPNMIVGLDAAGEVTPFASSDMYFSFVLPGTLTPAVTNAVSFWVGDDCCDTDSVTIRAYGLDNSLLDTQALSGVSFQFYSLSLAGIHRIAIENTSPHTGGYGVDDLSFNTPTSDVPEPSTWMLSSAGLLLALAVRRLRRGSLS